MRTVTNYLLVSLSFADAMSSTLNVIPNYSYMLTGHWPFGALYCKIVQFVSMLSICASVFSLMAIAFDRWVKKFDFFRTHYIMSNFKAMEKEQDNQASSNEKLISVLLHGKIRTIFKLFHLC